MADHPPSRLLRLPLELRELIYEFAVIADGDYGPTIHACEDPSRHTCSENSRRWFRDCGCLRGCLCVRIAPSLVSLLLVNRHFHEKVSQWFRRRYWVRLAEAQKFPYSRVFKHFIREEYGGLFSCSGMTRISVPNYSFATLENGNWLPQQVLLILLGFNDRPEVIRFIVKHVPREPRFTFRNTDLNDLLWSAAFPQDMLLGNHLGMVMRFTNNNSDNALETIQTKIMKEFKVRIGVLARFPKLTRLHLAVNSMECTMSSFYSIHGVPLVAALEELNQHPNVDNIRVQIEWVDTVNPWAEENLGLSLPSAEEKTALLSTLKESHAPRLKELKEV